MTPAIILLLVAFFAANTAALNGRDVVWQWHNFSASFCTPGPFLAEFRDHAMLHLAASDAVNSITGRYNTYYTYNGLGGAPKAPHLFQVNIRAVAIGAYLSMFTFNTQSRPGPYGAAAGVKFWTPAQQTSMIAAANALFTAQKNQLPFPNSHRIMRSLAYGNEVATYVYAKRLGDGFLKNFTFVGCDWPAGCQPGKWWAPTTAGVAWAQYAHIKLFSGKPYSYYRVPPPQIHFGKVANDSMQITEFYGRNVSSVRTASQSKVARYFVFSSQPMMLPQVIKFYSVQQTMGISALTRAMALFSITQQDAGSIHLENKFFYNLWRPWQHLNWPNSLNYRADYFNNNISQPNNNLNWIPYMTTPPNPEYPPGHPMMTSAGAQIIRRIFGDVGFGTQVGINFNGLITGEPFTDFFYGSLYEYEHEVLQARIWGGMHTHVSMIKGEQRGHNVADDLFSSILTPTSLASAGEEIETD